MNQEKIGKFIAERRKAIKLTQEELASKLGVSNRSVSNWENGKNMPDLSLFKDLCEILDISINEFLSGEKINSNNEDAINNVTLSLYTAKNKKNKIIKILSFSLVIFIIIFLLYYFLISYQSVKIYTINGNSENVNLSDGLFIITNENIYFDASDFLLTNEEDKITRLTLFYADKNHQKHFIASNTGDTLMFRDYMGYDDYFDTSNLDYIMKNMYLNIYYEDTMEQMKLSLIKDYVNKKIFHLKRDNIGVENKKANNPINVEDKYLLYRLRSRYEKYNDGYRYTKTENGITTEINLFNNLINIISDDSTKRKEWSYNINNHQMTYNDGKGNIINFDYNTIDVTKEEQNIIGKFYKIINDSLARK